MAINRFFLTCIAASALAVPALAQVPLDLPPGADDGQALLRELPTDDGKAVDPAVVDAFADAAAAYAAKDFASARNAWEGLAAEGIGAAQFNLGFMFEHGRGSAPDYAAAVGWYRRAADAEIPAAMVNLARLHFEGRGVARDPATALHWLESASALGSAVAAYNLGVAHLGAPGTGVKKDAETAARWFETAAERGHARAAYNLGVLYRDGDGVRRDTTRAEEYFAMAAENGDAVSHYALADMMIARAGAKAGKKDVLARAAGHLREAAEAGVLVAQNRLAIMLAKGDGVKRDRETALMWFHVTAGLGAGNAAKNRDALAHILSEDVRRRAARRADAFRPQAPKGGTPGAKTWAKN